MKRKTYSKSKLWQSTLDDYMLKFKNDKFVINPKDVEKCLSYQFMELDYNLKILGYTILDLFGIVKLED